MLVMCNKLIILHLTAMVGKPIEKTNANTLSVSLAAPGVSVSQIQSHSRLQRQLFHHSAGQVSC